MSKTPTLVMLVGLPYSGKTTFRHTLVESRMFKPPPVVVSTDDLLLDLATIVGSYDKAFAEHYSEVRLDAATTFHTALANKHDVVVDRTNVSIEARAQWLAPAKAERYLTIAVTFTEFSRADLLTRRAQRVEQVTPMTAIEYQASRFMYPTRSEGFDFIWTISQAMDMLHKARQRQPT